jgi:hypothetical protein
MLVHVPPEFEAVTNLHAALPLIEPHIRAAGLPATRAEHFQALWRAFLQRGMQPSGLVLHRLPGLIDVLGHTTTGTAGRWAQFCTRRRLWVHVPGRFVPPIQPASEQRVRAYLVIKPKPVG